MKKRLILFLLRTVLWNIALLWGKSLRILKSGNDDVDRLEREGKNYVIAFWHGSMFSGWFIHRPGPDNKMSALVSQSSDGEFLSTVLQRWGYSMIRGSSHIGGKEAMGLMVDAVIKGSSLAITPDGPRGPRHEMKMGAVRIAQRARVPLVLAGIAVKRKKILRSWDKFEVPMPFSTVAVSYSSPIMIPEEAGGEALDAVKYEIQEMLRQLDLKAEQMLADRSGAV